MGPFLYGEEVESEFWKEAWDVNNIGFHQEKLNPIMVEKFKDIDLEGKNVLIPLAGKTRDINFFTQRKANVIAVEVVEKAIHDYFNESSIDYNKETHKTYSLYSSPFLKFYHTDFFDADNLIDAEIHYVYDRASNVALPPELRKKYYAVIDKLTTTKTNFLIITYEHNGDSDFGPPFMVPAKEIVENYKIMKIDLKKKELSRNAEIEGRFKEANITEIIRTTWSNF